MKNLLFYLLLATSVFCHAQVTGFNNPWFFGKFANTNFYPPDSVIAKIRTYNTQVLRFPGGTIANRYDVTKPGYGYPKEYAQNYISNHARLAHDVDCQTSFVANLYMPLVQPDSEAYWIQNIVAAVKILNPTYVELGNEIQIYPEITGVATGNPNKLQNKAQFTATVIINAGRYVSLCQKVITAIRAAGFDPLFGVNMDQPFHDRGKAWNYVIRNWGDYDGEIYHIYLTTKTENATRDAINKIIASSTKPVWITEWGWSHGNGVTTVLNMQDVGKDYYNAFPDNFATACSQDSRIVMTCRHHLYGTSVYSVILP